jgi:uncharacterized FlaG/YvyC family protein
MKTKKQTQTDAPAQTTINIEQQQRDELNSKLKSIKKQLKEVEKGYARLR